MQPENSVNYVQAGIVRQLYFNDSLRFAELNVDGVPSDQFSYHLRQLVKYGVIEKNRYNAYQLTVLGRTRAIMLYPDKSTFVQQGFLGVRLVVTKVEASRRYILMQQRSAVPYKGKYATPGDRVLFGEDVQVAAARALEAQTGLSGTIALCGLHHLKDVYQHDIVQDKYFFVCAVSEPQGTLLAQGPSGANMWMAYDDLAKSDQLVHGCLELIGLAASDTMSFLEKTYRVETY